MEILAELPESVRPPRKRILHGLRTPMTRALATASRNRGSQLETMPHSAAGSAALPPGFEQPCRQRFLLLLALFLPPRRRRRRIRRFRSCCRALAPVNALRLHPATGG